MNPLFETIIIGAGPAGLTAAIYAGRFKLKALFFEKMAAGGQILLSPSIENYPGFPEGVSTFDLMDKFKKQVGDLGIKIEDKEVQSIVQEGKNYLVKTPDGDFLTQTVIIAVGAQSKRLGVIGEERLIGKGVSYCGTCDGPLFKNKDVVVIGGGDRAVEDALFLTSYANKVTLIHRRNEFRAAKVLVDKIKSNPKIELILESVAFEVLGDNRVIGVRIKNLKSNKESVVDCQGVFIFVGIKPNTEFIRNLLEVDEFGFIIVTPEMKTSKAGIFACGDCISKSLYQVISAAGEGAIAADSVHKYLLKL